MSLMKMEHVNDPREEILKQIGDISGIEIFNNQILCAVYIRPEKTKGGIILTDGIRGEDRFQGKVGLLIGMGPAAFQDESGQWFNNSSFKLHDWLVFRPSDGWGVTVNGVLCRMMSDTQVKARISSPDEVW